VGAGDVGAPVPVEIAEPSTVDCEVGGRERLPRGGAAARVVEAGAIRAEDIGFLVTVEVAEP